MGRHISSWKALLKEVLSPSASIQKRLKKEKKAKRKLQEALEFESKRRERVEDALKHSSSSSPSPEPLHAANNNTKNGTPDCLLVYFGVCFWSAFCPSALYLTAQSVFLNSFFIARLVFLHFFLFEYLSYPCSCFSSFLFQLGFFVTFFAKFTSWSYYFSQSLIQMFWIVFLLWLFHWLTVCPFTSIVTCWLKLLEPSAYRLLPFICLPSIKFSVTTNSSKCVFNQSVASPQTNTKKTPPQLTYTVQYWTCTSIFGCVQLWVSLLCSLKDKSSK